MSWDLKRIRERMEQAKASQTGALLHASLPRIHGKVKLTPEAAAGVLKALSDVESVKPGLGQAMAEGFLANWCAEMGAELGKRAAEKSAALDSSADSTSSADASTPGILLDEGVVAATFIGISRLVGKK